jgi:hypothetical protein
MGEGQNWGLALGSSNCAARLAALLAGLTPLGAGEIIPGIESILSAVGAFALEIVLEELNILTAVRAQDLEDIVCLPVTRILARASQ